MSDTAPPDIAAVPKGRMMTVRVIEIALRAGETYVQAARRAKVALSTAKHWAAAMNIRKCDLDGETAEDRIARYAGWAVALAGLGRIDEAGAFERDARQLETVVRHLDARIAQSDEAIDPQAPARAFLGRVAATLGAGADAITAWTEVSAYYRTLRGLGAVVWMDGTVSWPDGVPEEEVPPVPGWLPCAPWAVGDTEDWERTVGAAFRWL